MVIGVLWSTWHLWYVITPGGFSNVTGANALATYVRLTSTAIIYAWMYNSTNGSLFIAMLAHFGHNLAASLIATSVDGGWQHLTVALVYLIVASIVALMTEPRTLRRPSPALTGTGTGAGQIVQPSSVYLGSHSSLHRTVHALIWFPLAPQKRALES